MDLVSGVNSGYARLGRLQPIDDEKALLLLKIGRKALNIFGVD